MSEHAGGGAVWRPGRMSGNRGPGNQPWEADRASAVVHHARVLATIPAALGLLLDVAAFVLGAIELSAGASRTVLDDNMLGGFVIAATFSVVGWLVGSRRPANAIGWIFLVVGISQALATAAGTYARFGAATGSLDLPFAAELAWVDTWAWAPGFILLLTLSVLLFPDGRLPSAGWRPLLWLTAMALALVILPMAVAAWPIRSVALATSGPPSDEPRLAVAIALQGAGLIAALVAALGSIASLAVRFTRSRGIAREQLKWVTFAGAIEILFMASTPFVQGTLAGNLVAVAASLIVPSLLPVAAAFAILRYRLYDIDRIISRTISYAIVTALLGAAYLAAFFGLEALLAPLTSSGGSVAVAASTLVAFALFAPVRTRIAALVDRRFNRSHYDAELTVARLVGRLRDETDLEVLAAEVEAVVHSALAPSVVAVWSRGA